MRAAAVQLTATPRRDRQPRGRRRLVRARRRATAPTLVVLPEKWSVLGHGAALRAGAEPLDGPALTWARERRRASSASTSSPARSPSACAGEEQLRNTSVHIGPDGEIRAIYRKIHLFDVEVDGTVYRESEHEAPGDATGRSAPPPTAPSLGLSICYDLRFPELYRRLAVARRARPARARRLHARHRRATTGRRSCAPARSRTSASSSPPTRSASTSRAFGPAGAR